MPERLQDNLHYQFQDEALLNEALTHTSLHGKTSYERLEFLGDRVLGLCIAKLLYQSFPNENEGDLAKRHAALVQRKALYEVAASLKLGDFVSLSSNEAETGGRKKEAILADVVESLLGAIYLDGGYGAAEKVAFDLFSDMVKNQKAPPQDPKTRLQEYVQLHYKSLPDYNLISQFGPSHAPTFEIEVFAKGLPTMRASASSKRKAEKKAAELLLSYIDKQEKKNS